MSKPSKLSPIEMTPALQRALIKLRDADKAYDAAMGRAAIRVAGMNRADAIEALCALLNPEAEGHDNG